MRFVIDSSAIVPILHEEKETTNAETFFDLCYMNRISLSISPLVRCEVGNCIINFTRREGKDPFQYMERFLGIDLEIIPLDDALLLMATEIAHEKKLTFYDAIHAAGARSKGSPLITLDGELMTKVDDAIDLEEAVEILKMLP